MLKCHICWWFTVLNLFSKDFQSYFIFFYVKDHSTVIIWEQLPVIVHWNGQEKKITVSCNVKELKWK